MTELKTLKDLTRGDLKFSGVFVDGVPTKLLRQEAIKWIKAEYEGDFLKHPYHIDENTIEFIKHFFNLTDADIQLNKDESREKK